MNTKLLYLFLILTSSLAYAQVKIGVNPGNIDKASILELESSNKFIVITRMSDNQMIAATPLEGAMVYNTTNKCVYVYRIDTSNIPEWKSLCDSSSLTDRDTFVTGTTAPTSPHKGDIWINGNVTSGWDGVNWVVISKSIINGNGVPNPTSISPPKGGDLYVDNTSGNIYVYSAATNAWINKSQIKASNGLNVNTSKEVVLGGKLTTNTEIDVDSKIFKIKGLPLVNTTVNDNFMIVDKITGQLKQVSLANNLRQKEDTETASDGQIVFNGLNLLTTDKINVYRNGVRVNFTIDSPTQITLEPDAKCYAGDKIKIVQLY